MAARSVPHGGSAVPLTADVGSFDSIRSTAAASASAATASAAAATTAGEGRGGLAAARGAPDGAGRDDGPGPLDPDVPDVVFAAETEAPAGGATMARSRPFVTCEHMVRRRRGASKHDKKNQSTGTQRQEGKGSITSSVAELRKAHHTSMPSTPTTSAASSQTARPQHQQETESDQRQHQKRRKQPSESLKERQVHRAPATPPKPTMGADASCLDCNAQLDGTDSGINRPQDRGSSSHHHSVRKPG